MEKRKYGSALSRVQHRSVGQAMLAAAECLTCPILPDISARGRSLFLWVTLWWEAAQVAPETGAQGQGPSLRSGREDHELARQYMS